MGREEEEVARQFKDKMPPNMSGGTEGKQVSKEDKWGRTST